MRYKFRYNTHIRFIFSGYTKKTNCKQLENIKSTVIGFGKLHNNNKFRHKIYDKSMSNNSSKIWIKSYSIS